MRTTWLAILLLLISAAAPAAQVEFFSPQGEVKGVRQVAVRFRSEEHTSELQSPC